MPEYTAYIDGASSGNPGDAGIGIVILKDGKEIFRESRYIGRETNNVAEYTALLTVLKVAEKHKIEGIHIFTDSELVVKQLNGEYKIKNSVLKVLAAEAVEKKNTVNYGLSHIKREKNSAADKLAKEAVKRGGAAKAREKMR